MSAISTLSGTFVVTDDEFWSRLDSECIDRSHFDTQGDDHERVDLELVDKINTLIEPVLGEANENSRWWHNLECHGDGIRPLSMDFEVLNPQWLAQFQFMLVGPYEPFCILLQVHEQLYGEDDSKIGCVAIFNQKTMVTRGIANKLAIAA